MILEVSGLTDLTLITATSADSLTVDVTISQTCPIGAYNLAVKTVRCRDCAADGDTVILTENIALNVVSSSAAAAATAATTAAASTTTNATTASDASASTTNAS